jgi:hypothetical protein
MKLIGKQKMTKRFNMDARAALGKNWFAKPPAGFSLPSEAAISDVSIYANFIYDTDIGRMLETAIANLSSDSQSSRAAYIQNIQKWLQDNGPTIFVDEEMLQMCQDTNVLSHVRGTDIKTVYPVGYICLPKGKGFTSSFTKDSLHHLWFQIYEAGSHDLLINGKKHTLEMKGRRLFIHAYWDRIGDCSSFLLPLDNENDILEEVIKVNSTKLLAGQVNRGKTDTSTGMSVEELNKESSELSNWMAPLVCNILLLMQSYPQYFEKMPKENSYRQSFKGKKDPVSLRLHRSSKMDIFQKVYETESKKENAETENNKICRHWRRGHWKRQVHGDRWELENPEAKIIHMKDGRRAHMRWIMRVLVNKDLVQDHSLVKDILEKAN